MKKTKKERKRLVVISFLILLLLAFLINSVARDWGTILKNNKDYAELNKKYDTLMTEEEKLKSEVVKLQDDDYLARYAKEEYMYSSDGEVIIRID